MLRQKEYTIFIRPYMVLNGEEIPYTGTAYAPSLCPACNSNCPSYDILQGGKIEMEYEDERLPTNSAIILEEVIKDIITLKGYKREHVRAAEIIPIDLIIQPTK